MLFDEETRREIFPGDPVTTRKGKGGTLDRICMKSKRVYVKFGTFIQAFDPKIINCKLLE